ncbi:MAG: hypothetical protein ACRDD8_05410 [Bacteroidales bacterium]
MYWWAIPSSTGVILLKLSFGHFVIFNEMITIILLSIAFGLPFAYNCVQSSFNKANDISELADLEVGKIMKFFTVELPISFKSIANYMAISFMATWFKVNIIIPYNNGGLMYDTSNIDTMIYFEAMTSFDYPLGLKLSLISIMLCLFFTFIFWRCLIGIDSNECIYKFTNWIWDCYHKYSDIGTNSKTN